ncbi:MAG: transglycosylase domain-containing protein [Patescibacteria group bacterium]
MIKKYKKVVKKIKIPRPTKKRALFVLVPLLVIGLILLGIFYFIILKDLPSPTGLNQTTGSYSTHMYDRNGKLLYTLYSDRNQTFIPLSNMPKHLQQATIAVEDKDFYRHGAIDFRGIARAAYATMVHKRLEGGSTLTQQLVKNSLLSPERTITRKVKEIILAFATELLYSKDQILEMYLNQVPYGGTSYGAEAAAQTFLGKSAKDLTLAESAYLAGLPEAPSVLSPYGSHPEKGKERQEEILRRMYDQGYITKEQRDAAMKEKLVFEKISNPIKAPHFVFYVRDLLVKKYGEQVVEQGGLKVQTSLDLTLQEHAQATVAAEVAALKRNKVGNGGALITKPGTGEILAMVGSTDYFDSEHGNVNITLAKLQPGSSIKPINYAVGLIKGYTAATPFLDQAICFPNPGGKSYCPRNYDGNFHGVVQMREALANSYNIPAVQMLKLNGLDAMIATASAMGLTTFTDPSRYGLSLTLGGGEVMMTDMATAFGVFANQGYRVDLHPILKVTDRDGKVLEEYKPPKSPIFGEKVIPSEVAYIISDMLADNNARAPAFGTNSELRIPNQRVSVKTGTTNDYRDNWTIGYTPSYLIAVWVGNNDHTPMQGVVSGITGAAPIWNALMSHVLDGKKQEIPQKPPNVVGRYTCRGSMPPSASPAPEGGAQPAGCANKFEYFIKGVPEKSTGKVIREKVWIDKATNAQAQPGQTDNVEEREESVFIDNSGAKYCISCAHPVPSPTPTPAP